jgi:flagellar biosynthesis protein FlhF
MKLKSYFSGTVEAAMELARRELGEEAVLVNARPATPETRHLGAYEIVFGVPPRAAGPAAPQNLERISNPAADLERLAGELAQIRRQLGAFPPQEGRLFPSRAAEPKWMVANTPLPPVAPAHVDRPGIAAVEAVAAEPETDATLGASGSSRAVVMLVGPPGGGKTTTLVKLAVRYGLATRRRTQLISTDVVRIAAADQLRALATILGIGCDVVETPGALAQALEEHGSKDLILIDTPGLAGAEMEDAQQLADFAAGHPEIDVHLVLPASLRAVDMARIAQSYAVFRPGKLIFTKLDETASYAELAVESARLRIPISFLASGQKIPDDLEPATRKRFAALFEAGAQQRPRTQGASA